MLISIICINEGSLDKFRSQTSNNMDTWKSRGGKSQRREEKRREEKSRGEERRGEERREEKRRERVRRKKMQTAGARRGRKGVKHGAFPMICGSEG